jgi:predicted transposase YdaD
MEWERQRTYDFENGKEAKAIEAAINLLKMKNLSPDEIAQALDLPLEKVLELQQQLLVKV